MKLAYWMYAGPAHIGTLRVASSFKNVHAIMHAPLGDDYFNVMRSMLERERDFTPVTASIVDRHVLARGSQHKVVENITRKDKEEKPDLILLTPTCTSSILQEDLEHFVDRAKESANCDVLLADVNHYRVNELQAADRTLEQVVRYYTTEGRVSEHTKEANTTFGRDNSRRPASQTKTPYPSANILGIFTLGFHNQHDCRELTTMLNHLGIRVNQVIPEGGSITRLKDLPKAWFNIVPYREVGLMAAHYLENKFNQPFISTTPMGVIDTATFLNQIAQILNDLIEQNQVFEAQDVADRTAETGYLPSETRSVEALTSEAAFGSTNCKTTNASTEGSRPQQTKENYQKKISEYIDSQTRFVSQAAWFSRSIDCQNLTGKKVVVFGDSTHSASMTKILAREMGVRVSCAGTYCSHDSDWFREQVTGFCDEILITEDHTQVGHMIGRIEPAAIFGTQMERHIGKKLDIPCGVISAPVHIQNFPLGYRPFLGYEGTNQIADLVYNSFTLGMEDHLLEIFGGHDTVMKNQNKESSVVTNGDATGTIEDRSRQRKAASNMQPKVESGNKEQNISSFPWSQEATQELLKIPGFVRGKVKRNTEKFAQENNYNEISLTIMYKAKEAAATGIK